MSKHVKNHPSSNPKENSAQKETTNRHVYIEPGAQIDFVKNLKDQHEADRREDAASHKKQVFWTKVGAGLVLTYTLVSLWQLKTTREFFQRDQRPYVFSIKVNPAKFAPPDNRLATEIFYYNYGKSPALHMKDVGWIFIGADQNLVDGWFKQLGDGPLETVNLEPNDRKGSQKPFLYEDVLMQGERPILTTLFSRGTAASLDVGYIVAIRFQYFDTFGKRYWSDVCFQHFPGPSEEVGNRCMAHNEIH